MKQPDSIRLAPPVAAVKPRSQQRHGETLTDPYAWLRDDNWREALRDPARLDPEIRAYLEAENDYADACLEDDAALRKRLVQEMRGRMAETDSSVPDQDGPWLYFERFEAGGEQPAYYRLPAADPDAPPACLLDGEALSRRFSYFDLGEMGHSRDHRLLAYSADYNGAELYEIRLIDLATGEAVGEPIPETTGQVLWSADSRWLFYVTLDDNHRPCDVWRLRVGEPAASATRVYSEADPGFFVSLDETQSGRFLLISAHDHETGEVHVIPADAPKTPPQLFAARRTGVEYDIDDSGDAWTILTNDGAEDFCLMSAPHGRTTPDHWSVLLAHQPGRLILGLIEYRHFRVWLERVDALPRLVVMDKRSGESHPVAFDDEAYALGMDPGYAFDTTTLRFVYSAPHRPDETWDYDMHTRQRQLRKRRVLPCGHDPSRYTVRRLQAATADGEQVPVTVLHRRDLKLDGGNPCLLYGYGAYGISESAHFSASRLSLVDRGVVYAIAHIRGGKEKGYRWYRLGKGACKQNSFSDFASAADLLCQAGYTTPGRLAAMGGSAGGLLVGAVLNQRPELFGAAVADVPFVDTLNTMLDANLPLTPPEWPEWGNPIESAEAFRQIRSYCPYENVRPQRYPPLLIIAGVSDPRVTYWEPAKWAARLRATKTDDNLLLLKTNMEAGHAGLPGRYQALEEIALIHGFILRALDV